VKRQEFAAQIGVAHTATERCEGGIAMQRNIYEQLNRFEKALKLIQRIAACRQKMPGLQNTDIYQAMCPEAWEIAAREAGVNPPSAETKQLVGRILAAAEGNT
jgi:hypothetical protein